MHQIEQLLKNKRISDIPSAWEDARRTGPSMLVFFSSHSFRLMVCRSTAPSGKSTVDEPASGESLVNEVIGLCLHSGKVFWFD